MCWEGAHLATVNSQAENDFLTAQFIQLETESWLGGTDELSEGTWRWITGEPWSFQNWQAGEPNDLNTYEDYLQLPSVWSGLWNDAPGGQSDSVFRFSRSYICEWERRYDSIATLSDITGDAIPDYATAYREAGNIFLLTINGATGAPIKRIVIGAEGTLNSVSISAASGDISVLLSRSNGAASIQVRDEVTLAVTATINNLR